MEGSGRALAKSLWSDPEYRIGPHYATAEDRFNHAGKDQKAPGGHADAGREDGVIRNRRIRG